VPRSSGLEISKNAHFIGDTSNYIDFLIFREQKKNDKAEASNN